MIEFLLKISILVWPFGQLLSVRLGQNNLPVYLLDVLSLFLTIVLLIINSSRRKILKDPITPYLLGFLIICALSLFSNAFSLSRVQILKALFYLLRAVTYPSFYFAVKQVDLKRIKTSIISSLTIFVSLGVVQYVFFPDTRALKFVGFDDHYYRLIGTSFDPNYTGAILASIGLYFLSTSRIILSIAVIPLLALTYSRASYLTYFIGFIYEIIRKKKAIFLFLLLIIPISILISPKPYGEGINLLRTFSIFSRFTSWQTGLNLFIAKPLLGWGFNTLTDLNGQRIGIDNSYIYIFATTGLAGLASFITLIFKSLKPISKSVFFLPLLAILFHSLFNNSFFFIWINSFYWLVLGLASKSKEQI